MHDIDDTPAIEKHWHWSFTAYDADEQPVQVSVIGYNCEADARIAAESVVTRQTFVLTHVWECVTCRAQAKQLQAVRSIADGMRD